MSHYRYEEEALGADIQEERLEDEVGCYYPGRCVMPGYHLRGECHEAPAEYGDPMAAEVA